MPAKRKLRLGTEQPIEGLLHFIHLNIIDHDHNRLVDVKGMLIQSEIGRDQDHRET